MPDEPITPEKDYLNRRTFLRAGVLVGSVAATGWLYRRFNSARRAPEPQAAQLANLVPATQSAGGVAAATTQGFRVDEPQTSLQDVTHYNNFY